MTAVLLVGGLLQQGGPANAADEEIAVVQAFDFEPGSPFPVAATGDANVAQASNARTGEGSVFVGWHEAADGGATLEIDTAGLVPGWWYDLETHYFTSGSTIVEEIEGYALGWWDFSSVHDTTHGSGPDGYWLDGNIHFQYLGERPLLLPFAHFDAEATYCGRPNDPPRSAYFDDLALRVSTFQGPTIRSTPNCPTTTTTTTTAPPTQVTTTRTTSPGPGIGTPSTTTVAPSETGGTGAGTTTTTTVTPPPATTIPATTSPAAPSCTAAYQVLGTWRGHHIVRVVVKAGPKALNGWKVTWNTTPTAVKHSWSALVTKRGSTITAVNQRWNGRVAAGAKVEFGLILASPTPPVATSVACMAR